MKWRMLIIMNVLNNQLIFNIKTLLMEPTCTMASDMTALYLMWEIPQDVLQWKTVYNTSQGPGDKPTWETVLHPARVRVIKRRKPKGSNLPRLSWLTEAETTWTLWHTTLTTQWLATKTSLLRPLRRWTCWTSLLRPLRGWTTRTSHPIL